MINYLTTDTLPEIVDKNKSNILYLLQEFADGGISYKDLVAKVEANAVTAAKAISDAAAAQAKADSHDQPIRNNAAAALAAQQKADQNAADIVKAVADINANAAAIARIINDGIGGYLGTFAASDGDDFTVLPQTANSKERAITEFLEGTEYFYQEWVWNDPDGWTKLGTKTDSHIHSQSAGISLADVAAQQDPKIQKALTDAKAYSDTILSPYEKKEITITPAIYGWKTITDLWTNDDKFEKYKDKKIRVTYDNSTWSQTETNSMFIYADAGPTIKYFQGSTTTSPNFNDVVFSIIELDINKPNKVLYGPRLINEWVLTKVEIWDIVTPAVKATVLVEK